MITKCYIIVGCQEMNDFGEVVIKHTQACGSVTEICKYLKKMYDFPITECRKLIVKAFGHKTVVWININGIDTVRISQSRVEPEVRLHGCW